MASLRVRAASSQRSSAIAVGAMVPVTGPFNVSGQQYHFSLQMAQDEINAKGGVAGKKLKIVFDRGPGVPWWLEVAVP